MTMKHLDPKAARHRAGFFRAHNPPVLTHNARILSITPF